MRAACTTVRRRVGPAGRPSGVARLGLGIAVVVLVSCSGDPGTSTVTAGPHAPATTRPGAPAPEEAASAGGRSGEPPGRGSIHQEVHPDPGAVAHPVAMDEVAEFGNGVQARLRSVEPIEAEGHLPGERSGPAVVVSVEIVNGSSHAIGLDTVTVDLATRDGSSAYGVEVPGHRPLGGDLAPGGTALGDYVFTLAPSERTGVRVRVKYAADAPTVVFEGSIGDG